MTEDPDSPSTDQLLKRIVQLEGMAALVKRQQAEINSLKATIADLGRAFKAEVTNVTAEFQHDRTEFTRVYQFISVIHDQLWPLVHKVFPGSLATQQQIAAIKRNGGRSWDDKKV